MLSLATTKVIESPHIETHKKKLKKRKRLFLTPKKLNYGMLLKMIKKKRNHLWLI